MLSRPKSSSVDHSLAMSSLIRLYPTAYVSTFYKLVAVCYGILVVFRGVFLPIESCLGPKS